MIDRTNKVYFGDCRESMRSIIAQGIKVQMCVTSPPYFNLRNYGHDGQIGQESTPEEFIANLVDVFRLVRELLSDDGVLFLNIGDSYFGSGKGPTGYNGIGDKTKRQGFSSAADVRRVAAYGTSDKEPVNSPKHDCLCGSLCDACRKAYQIGKSHRGCQPVPTPSPLPSETILEHKESQTDHLPTLDSLNLENRSESAIPDSANTGDPAFELLHDEQESTTPLSSRQHETEYLAVEIRGALCQLCGCSLPDCVQESVDKTACTCGIESTLNSSTQGKKDKVYLDSAYPHSTTEHLKPKDLIGIPWMLAFALRADGWYLRSDIIWHKPNPMPESVTDRPTKAHEYLFLLSKSQKYYYNADAIKEPVAESTIGRGKVDFGGAKGRKYKSGIQKEDPNYRNGGEQWGRTFDYTVSCKDGRNKRSVWTVPTTPYSGAHFATYPPELIIPCILAGSRDGDIVFDPFFGSGTTGETAERLGRKWIGCELNQQYKKLQDKRTEQVGMIWGTS